MINFKSVFIETLGDPIDYDELENYINFVTESKLYYDTDMYCQIHHILPRCRFEDYEFVENNFCRLSIPDHYRAHELLANAYPIREFTRPLNFFNKPEDYDYDNHFENISIAAKIEWIKFKETEKYQEWRKKKSESTSDIMKSWLSKHLSDLRKNKPGNLERLSNHFTELWEREGYRESQIEKFKAYNALPETKERKSKEQTEIWANRSSEYREEFRSKMDTINSCELKRADAGEKIKKLWESEEYRNKTVTNQAKKLIERKENGTYKSNSEKFKLKWQDPIWKAKVLEDRKINREKRKLEKQNETN